MMDPYYRRLRRRRFLQRAFVITVFFGILSLPLLYLMRGEVRRVAAFSYHQIKAVAAQIRPAIQSAAPSAAPSPPPAPVVAEAPPPAQAVAQAPPQTPPRAASGDGPMRPASIGGASFRIPAGYIARDDDLKQKNMLVLHALLPELGPRAAGKARCAPKEAYCLDFTVLRVTAGKSSLESTMQKRYRRGPRQIELLPVSHNLRQVPPRRSGELGGRHFIGEADGRPVWLRCRDLIGPPREVAPGPSRRTIRVKGRLQTIERQPRPSKIATAPSKVEVLAGYCTMTFDMPDGMSVSLRFASLHLDRWADIQAKAARLVTRIRG